MKKLLSVLSIAALALTVSPAFAHDDHEANGEAEGRAKVEAQGRFQFPFNIKLGLDKFVAVGTVASVSASSIELNVQAGAHLNNVSNGMVTVKTDADTETHGNVSVGDKVIVKGEITANGSLEADSVRVIGEANAKNENEAKVEARKHVAFGQITAKTDNSVTVSNSLTGVSKTVSVNPDTDVKINGEAKTTADIQVGDSGWVKFKATVDAFVAQVINLFR